MNEGASAVNRKRKSLLGIYNMVPNLLWSLLNLTPILIFCWYYTSLKLLALFGSISVLPVFFPYSFLNKFQVGNRPKDYHKFGVRWIKKVSQNGDIINALVRRQFPDHKILHHDARSLSGLIRQTYMFEKFHWILFLFFTQVMMYALIQSQWVWAGILFITNIIYNILPNLLQQYIRLRLSLNNKKESKS